ncbi:MAG: hydroxymethylglutaryl-CoA lyase [Xanthomonadales bacterium]|nr:hydroxymethylglutaryl-CoA lyase [Xanthomonadales bacterium]
MSSIRIIDVSPRDGLQSEHQILPAETKVELIRRLAAAGISAVEATSFVNPKRVPQMADATEVIALLKEQEVPVHAIGLALNVKGCERAIEAGVNEVGFVLVSTDTFSQRNQGAPVSRSVEIWHEIHALCRAAGVQCNVLIASAFGCPFEGEVPAQRVLDLAEQLLESQPDTIGVADSIGVGVPMQMKNVIQPLSAMVDIPVRCHLHDTRNTGIANALAAIEAGATRIDASTGGIGGCPFAPAATGNIATEDLLYALNRSGIDCGVNIDGILETASWLADQLGHDVPSSLLRAGVFPSKVA